jgi:8-oxo-dGTP pyrophosphatase MutT (NUDIX family)
MSSDPLPWKRVGRGERRDHHVLRVGEDVFADPRDGQERSRVIIDADDWCNVVPITRAGDVVLVRQFRFGSGSVSLELPGGVVDGGEDAAATAARELEEETGYRAARILPLGTYSPNPAHFTNRVHAFVALDCEPVHDGHPDSGEDLRVEVVPRAKVKELAAAGEIDHALILSTVALAVLKGYL